MWISVKERLPEESQIVLAYTGAAILLLYLSGASFYELGHGPDWNEFNSARMHVTHWQPLPPFPEAP